MNVGVGVHTHIYTRTQFAYEDPMLLRNLQMLSCCLLAFMFSDLQKGRLCSDMFVGCVGFALVL